MKIYLAVILTFFSSWIYSQDTKSLYSVYTSKITQGYSNKNVLNKKKMVNRIFEEFYAQCKKDGLDKKQCNNTIEKTMVLLIYENAKKGSDFLDQGNHIEAIVFFKEAIRIMDSVDIIPFYAWFKALVYYSLGLSYDKMGNYPDAIDSYKKALRCLPNVDYMRNHEGETGKIASLAFTFVVELAKNYSLLGLYQDAINSLNNSLQIIEMIKKNKVFDYYNDVYVYYEIGTNYASMNNFEKAEYYFRKSLRAYRTDIKNNKGIKLVSIYRSLGDTYFSQNKYKKSVYYYNKFLYKAKHDTAFDINIIGNVYGMLALSYQRIGKDKQVMETHKNAIEFLKNVDYSKSSGETKILALLQLSLYYFSIKDDNNGIENLEKLFRNLIDYQSLPAYDTSLDYIHANVVSILMSHYVKAGKIDDAYRIYQQGTTMSLLKKINKDVAFAKSGVPIEKVIEHQHKQSEIFTLKSEINSLKETMKVDEIHESFLKESNLKDKNNEYTAFISKLENEFPEFKKYNKPEFPEISKIQKELKDGEYSINYYFTDSPLVEDTVGAFLIGKTGNIEHVILEKNEDTEKAFECLEMDIATCVQTVVKNYRTLLKARMAFNSIQKIQTIDKRILFRIKDDDDGYTQIGKKIYTIIKTDYFSISEELNTGSQKKIEVGTVITDQIDETERASLIKEYEKFLQTVLLRTIVDKVKNKEAELPKGIFQKLSYWFRKVFGIKRTPVLLISPYGILHFLPWSKLEPENVKIKLYHSPTIWYQLRTRESTTYKNPLLAIGNPIYDTQYSSQIQIQSNQKKEASNWLKPEYKDFFLKGIRNLDFLDWPNLNYSLKEITDINSKFYEDNEAKKHSITGLYANHFNIMEKNKKGLLKNYHTLFFSVHGLFDDNNPEMNALVLSLPSKVLKKKNESSVSSMFKMEYETYIKNYNIENKDKTILNSNEGDDDFKLYHSNSYLTLNDIKSLDINSDLVVLSACETSLGHNVSGDGMMGIPQGFLFAGANHVLATLWKVDEEATYIFMKNYFERIKDSIKNGSKIDYYKTLKEVQEDFKKGKFNSDKEDYTDPYFWAPFIIYGD